MEYEINRKANKTGKRAVYFATVNGKRIGRTNWARKYDAKAEMRSLIERMGEEKIKAWAGIA